MEQGFAGGVFSVLRARITRLQQDVVVAKDLWGAEAERKKGMRKRCSQSKRLQELDVMLEYAYRTSVA